MAPVIPLMAARSLLASSSRLGRPALLRQLHFNQAQRSLSTSLSRRDILSELDKQLHPREIVEKKKKEMEEKYAEKLRKRAEAEGVQDVEELKKKVLAPSVREELRKQGKIESIVAEEGKGAEKSVEQKAAPERPRAKREPTSQAEGDRAGIKPLSSIINLPLLHLTPHDTTAIHQIWNAYHTTHPTLSSAFLSASLPASTYTSMITLARENPFFILPLPRLAAEPAEGETPEVKTDEYEMFYLQWLFHPTPTNTAPPTGGAAPAPLPLTTSVIFTPLEEFKKSGEWAQPYLVLTHYPDLAQTHDLVLMRGEISPATASGPDGSAANPGFLLSQQQSQLLALALQRFYCTGIAVPGEGEKGKADREKRMAALKGLREKPEEWSWVGLVEMAYAGVV
ncbi:hypothetical protein IAT38_003244 [Cryptococcus sp. DSM 104549]